MFPTIEVQYLLLFLIFGIDFGRIEHECVESEGNEAEPENGRFL